MTGDTRPALSRAPVPTTGASPKPAARAADGLVRVVALNSLFGMAAQVGVKILSFGFTVFVVRRLGPDAYGQYAAVLAFGAMFVFIADLGLSPYAVREVARWRGTSSAVGQSSALYGALIGLRLVLSCLAAGLVLLVGWLTGRPPVMLVAIAIGGVGLVFFSLQGASDAVLAGFERFDLTSSAKVLSQLAFVSIGTLALWLGLSYWGLMVANTAGALLIAVLSWRWLRTIGVRPKGQTVSEWMRLLRASAPFAVSGLALGLSYKFDSVLLSMYRGDAETGYYNAAYNLVFTALVLSNSLNSALYPSLAREAVGAPGRFPRVAERILCYLMAAGLPIAVGTWTLAHRLVPLLFSRSYEASAPTLQIVILVVPLMFASDFLGYLAILKGMERRAARSIMVSSGVNVGLNLLLVPTFGLRAAAIMTVATEALLVSQYVWTLRATLRGLDWGRVLVRPLAAALLMGQLLVLLQAAPLWFLVPAGAVAYAALLLGLRVFGPDELRFIRAMRRPIGGDSGVLTMPMGRAS